LLAAIFLAACFALLDETLSLRDELVGLNRDSEPTGSENLKENSPPLFTFETDKVGGLGRRAAAV
jgi:hypothetical protein